MAECIACERLKQIAGPPNPEDEEARLEALYDTRILDTPPEERFDRIVKLAAQIFDVPISYISLVDAGRQWFKAQSGLNGLKETPRNISFCGYAILQDTALVVPDATADERFADNPLVVGEPFVRFYAGHPVRSRGKKIGTLCLMDRRPREFSERDHALLQRLAELVEHEFDLVDVIEVQSELLTAQEEYLRQQQELERLYAELSAEKEKSDRLLLNILPERIADELKRRGSVDAELHDDVCVLFADFTDFTAVSAGFTPRQLLTELNACFSRFDEITEQFGVEKLKTIGDGYLCVSGLGESNATAAVDLLRAAIEMRDFISERQAAELRAGRHYWNVRIGLHLGPLVAGVVGTRKFAFDVWGDTVNTAARLESASEPGRINISRAYYERVAEEISAESRGAVFTKSKGFMEMFFVNEVRVR